MTETTTDGGSQHEWPSVNEQLDILIIALDKHAERLSEGRWRVGDYVFRTSYVFGEASATLVKFGGVTPIDQYVGKDILTWVIEGALTPTPIRNRIGAELYLRGYHSHV